MYQHMSIKALVYLLTQLNVDGLRDESLRALACLFERQSPSTLGLAKVHLIL